MPGSPDKVVSFATHEQGSSYISSKIVQRIGREKDPEDNRVVITLRYTRTSLEESGRGRRYILKGCSFKVKDGFATDIAIGKELRDRIMSAEDPEYFDTDSSGEDAGM
jgi:hypothetical protein